MLRKKKNNFSNMTLKQKTGGRMAPKSPMHEEDGTADDLPRSLDEIFAEITKMNSILQSVATDIRTSKLLRK